MADILREQYTSVFSTPRKDLSSLKLRSYNCEYLNDIEITAEQIIEAAKDMNPSSAPGPDGIPAYLLKEYIKELAYPIKKYGDMHWTWEKCQE